MTHFLSTQDFEYKQDENGRKVMAIIGSPGVSLVVFHSHGCPICKEFVPRFRQMANLILGCRFALCDIDKNSEIPMLSRDTTTPIVYVPMIELYYDGFPIVEYKNMEDRSAHSIKEFISTTLKELQYTGRIHTTSTRPRIPRQGSPSEGHPYNVEETDESYQDYSIAYK